MRLRLKLKLNSFVRRASVCRGAAVLAGVVATANGAVAQTTTAPQAFNDRISVYIGSSSDIGGSIGIDTNIASVTSPLTMPADPFGPGLYVIKADLNRPTGRSAGGSRLFVRVDGGIGAGGFDYMFGDIGQPAGPVTGTLAEGGAWVVSPVVSGNYLKATWLTGRVSYTTTIRGATTTKIIDPQIQIAMTAAVVNDTVRFEFDAQNLSARQHTLQLAFIEDVNANQIYANGSNPFYNSPLRLPNRADLTTEALLTGGQIPAYWETTYQAPGQSSVDPKYFQSARGTLLPVAGAGEPTAPLQFAYGDATALNGSFVPGSVAGSAASLARYLNVWNFSPQTTVILSGAGAATPNAGVGLYYGLNTLIPNDTTRIVAYVGQDTSNSNLAPPLGLSVTSLPALEYASGRAQRFVTMGADPNSFPITAYVANESDIAPSYTAGSQNVSVTLTLPKGLKIADGSTLTQTVTALAAGSQQPVTWLVTPDTSTTSATGGFQAGMQTYSVTASSSVSAGVNGSGGNVPITRTISRNIDIPAPLNFTIKGTGGINNKYRMISFPFSSNGKAPSAAFRLNGLTLNLDPNSFNILQYDSAAGYTVPSTLTPGMAYWIRLTRTADANISVDPTQFPPLSTQAAPVTYTSGWHLIGDPYVYGIKLSDVLVTNSTTGTAYTMDQATSTAGLISPTIYHYDSSDPNPANWGYSIEPNIGFTLVPFEGYWVYFNVSKVTLTYPFPTTPLGSVTP